MKLTVIGCASGMPSPEAAHSCYLVTEGNETFIFDCGGGAPSAMIRCRTDTSLVTNLFISHTHPDHVTGLPMFIQMEYLKQRRQPLAIHIPSEFERPFRVMMRSHYLFFEKLSFDIEVRTIEDGYEFGESGIRVRASANSHLQANRQLVESVGLENRMQCFSFLVSSDAGKLAYSADVGGLDDLRAVSRNVDLLLTEGMHIDLAQLPEFLIRQGVKRCMLTHLPNTFDNEEARMSFAKSGCHNVEFAHEGLTVDV